MAKTKKDEKGIQVYDADRLAKNANVGMSRVDPEDIRPPQMLLIQKSSTLEDFKTSEGQTPKVGNYFHTGELKIYDDFECYFIYAAKSEYLDRRKPKEGRKAQYRALAVTADDLSLFAMTFRSSALYALSPLFGIAKAQKRPMYSIKCKVETKMLSGEKGDWYVPVVRIEKLETDSGTLVFLEDMAKNFNVRTDEDKEVADVRENS